MTLEEFLDKPRALKRQIKGMVDKVQRIRETMVDTSARISDMPRSGSPNLQPMETMMGIISETEDAIKATRGEMEQAQAAITELTVTHLDGELAAIIILRATPHNKEQGENKRKEPAKSRPHVR